MHKVRNLIKPYCLASTPLLSDSIIPSRCVSDVASPNEEIPKAPSINTQTDSLDDVIKYRNDLFDATKKKQLSNLVPRLEKIEVRYQGRGISDSALMFMNKHMSTPYHCAMHVSKIVADSGVLALLTPSTKDELLPTPNKPLKGTEVANEEKVKELAPQPQLWDIHTPIPCDCKIEIMKFNMENSTEWHHQQVNHVYWNSCSLVLGAVMQQAFKRNYDIGFYHIPRIPEKKGAFCYDIVLDEKLNDWEPTEKDLVYFTKVARSIISENSKFERLEMSPDTAFQMFEDDSPSFHHIPTQLDSEVTLLSSRQAAACLDWRLPFIGEGYAGKYQCERIQEIMNKQGENAPIVAYRVGQYIDLSSGPHIASTALMYHYVVVAFHRLFCGDNQDIRRVQGLSLPKDLRVQHAVWAMLESRARKLVKQDFKHSASDEESESRDEYKLFPYHSIENKTKKYMLSTGQWREGTWKGTKNSFKPDKNNS